MLPSHVRLIAAAIAVLTASAAAQHSAAEPYRPRVLDAGDAPQKAMSSFEPSDGFAIELIAAEPQLANPVAFHIGFDGRIYVVETHRLGAGVIDMRSYQGWVQQDLACQTVDDRLAAIREHFAGDLPAWTSESERIRCLIDDDGDGKTDRATVFADGFDEMADGIAAGVLADGNDVWFTDIPHVWKLSDADRDGVADARRAMHSGYGVHFSLIGHDMHGLRIGPDRRVYFSIGDRGFHVEHEGRVLHHPHEGAVLRCELDGSGLEVVHRGLRNPQELAFDAHGNLFTGDNNSDGGDQARWVYVVEGGDSGWTIGFQWLPTRGAWNEEGWWKPRHDAQPAFLVPPVRNIANGPSGLAFYPGTGLPALYADTFFLCDFRGTPNVSGVLAVKLEEDGASFRISSEDQFLWKVLCTDIEFGMRGGLYVLDWVQGWGLTGRGRVWRTFDTASEDDPAITSTASLLRSGMGTRDLAELGALLAHADQRVRQAAQFELCDRGADGLAALLHVARLDGATLPRLHAIWGVGICGRHGDEDMLFNLFPLLADRDPEVRAQAAKVLGDAAHAPARDSLIAHLGADEAPRVRFFAAQALGRIGDVAAVTPLLEMLRRNDDRDAYERHAAVVALARIGDADRILQHATDASAAVRMAILLVLRQLEHPGIARFLDDSDPRLVLEAARAIHDRRIAGALTALGQMSAGPASRLDGMPLVRRVLGALRIHGDSTDVRALIAFAQRTDVAEAMRVEALQILAEWPSPDGQDRVLGEWRPLPTHRNALVAKVALRDALGRICGDGPDAVVRAACDAVAALDVPDSARALAAVASTTTRDGQTRARALEVLAMHADADTRRTAAMAVGADDPLPLRRVARAVLAELAPEAAVPVLLSLARDPKAPLEERRGALATLADLHVDGIDAALLAELGKLTSEAVPAGLRLDVVEAALARGTGAAFDAASAEVAARPFEFCADGGDAKAGERVFREHVAATCIRCHTLGGSGGAAGPVLDGIGKKRDRAYLLRAVTEPGADIAEGFGMLTLKRRDGAVVAGTVKTEDAERIVMFDAAGAEISVPIADIASRQLGGSAMPPMGPILSRRELRDVIEFLATRR